MSLGQIIRDRRRELRLTLDEVADRTGFSKPYLSTVETGKVKNPPSDNCLGKLEQVLEFDPGLLQHIAHIESMPADIRSDYEAADAENRRFKQIIRNIVRHKSNVKQIEQILLEEQISDDSASEQSSILTAGQLIPVVNRVSAGYPYDFDDFGIPAGGGDEYIRCLDIHDPNAFAVRVVGDYMEPKFCAGDVVVFSPSMEVSNGDDCFVRFIKPGKCVFKRVYFENDGKIRLQPRNDKYPPEFVDGESVKGLWRAAIRYERL